METLGTKCPIKRGVRVREGIVHCWNMSQCPLMGGVGLREVSSATVWSNCNQQRVCARRTRREVHFLLPFVAVYNLLF